MERPPCRSVADVAVVEARKFCCVEGGGREGVSGLDLSQLSVESGGSKWRSPRPGFVIQTLSLPQFCKPMPHRSFREACPMSGTGGVSLSLAPEVLSHTSPVFSIEGDGGFSGFPRLAGDECGSKELNMYLCPMVRE